MAVQMDSLRGLLGIKRMDGMPNARIRELCRETKWVDERIDASVLRWFGYIGRKGDDRTAKKVYVGKHVGIPLVCRPRKRWTDSMNDCLKKKSFECWASKEDCVR